MIRTLLVAAAILFALSLVGILVLALSGVQPDPRIIYALVALMTLCIFPLAIAGLQRRMQRGRSAGFGIGVNIVDIIEAIRGEELSRDARVRAQAIAIALAVIAAAIGVIVAFIQRT